MNIKRILKISLWACFGLFLASCLMLGVAYWSVSASLPKVDTLSDYRPPIVTTIYADDETVISEFSQERRILVPISRIPRQLVQAFVAAEDSKFYQHRGIDLFSIVRAALKNLMAGGIRQGGSTITQQVAKSLLLTPEKKFSRKFKEAILARRMERSLSKDDILFLYLNQIYLGHGAYGVQAAAENYFDKNVGDLSLAESAMLAGLPQAPSRYSPFHNYEKAKTRQIYVLNRMVEDGYITRQQADKAVSENVVIHPRNERQIPGAAYFTEQVRRYLEERYGTEVLNTGGLKVYTTMNVAMQQAAQLAVRSNLVQHDIRRGYRGPLKTFDSDRQAEFLSKQEAIYKQPPEPGTLVEGVVIGSRDHRAIVRIGRFTGIIPLNQGGLAHKLRVVDRGQKVKFVGERATTLPIGSVVQVKIKQSSDTEMTLSLYQEPAAQGALIALAPHTGEVKALVGGYDFNRSQFNRAIQAHRLPGSAFKPLIYAAALDKGYTPATIMLDTPVIYRQKGEDGTETEWKPKNYAEKFTGVTTLRQALAQSYNVVTIKMLQDIGVGYAINYAKKLGIESPLNRDLTLALGSSAVSPMELASAYCVFANGGVLLRPVYITKVVDRHGRILESRDPADFPGGPDPDQTLINQFPRRVISPETAYLITNLMESVVQDGTGYRAKALQRPVACKTGTTNDQKDAWFVGYGPRLLAVSWVGYDQERSLGPLETGSKAAAPAWVEFMRQALENQPVEHFPVPDGIEFRPIDPATGLLVPEDASTMTVEAFAPGTAPTRYALEAQQPQAIDFFQMDMEE
ncbi:penicillin-binding protein 1A [Syntrophotalea acetylenica]|uniref:peptidoglycan glycosyltransferase n=1 Tax=Syntrophotalea acetylenica TaxID=29542 RepID=A0A1L3GFJ3_SYNAC|nr:PBP1A family penicillin-binding protein [Syntrophotalea acetylenica]APG24721.1 penicillin-binding protein [Syntrophotalea acetylenica]APG42776.1 penicillin-binding protein [Syntrophotalea acetylenica]